MTKSAEQAARWGHDIVSLEEHDDLSSEWKEVREAGELWGGRRRGTCDCFFCVTSVPTGFYFQVEEVLSAL